MSLFVLFTIGFSTARAKLNNFGIFKRWFFNSLLAFFKQ